MFNAGDTTCFERIGKVLRRIVGARRVTPPRSPRFLHLGARRAFRPSWRSRWLPLPCCWWRQQLPALYLRIRARGDAGVRKRQKTRRFDQRLAAGGEVVAAAQTVNNGSGWSLSAVAHHGVVALIFAG
jgi:hypothetical protein